MKTDYRIRLTLDFEPDLRDYPPSVTSKQGALQFELKSILEGHVGVEDLLSVIDDVVYEIVEVQVAE